MKSTPGIRLVASVGKVGGAGMAALLWASAAFAMPAGESPAGWYADGESLVAERRARVEAGEARNLILFVGDGMSLATVAAARILEGQLRGQSGEENLLHFETFPYTAFAKPYNTDQQSPDSAGTMTAMVTGIKSFAGALSVDQLAGYGDCESAKGRELVTLLDLAALAGLGTGVVTNTRITHATPAALFARAPNRRWESDSGLPAAAREAGCRDIARQMIEYDLGRGIDVILGGGRRAFLPREARDPEYPDLPGHRSDGRDLIAQWQARHPDGRWVWNLEQFGGLAPAEPGPVLGLFEPDHMHYEHDRAGAAAGEPSLTEMTRQSIAMLQTRGEGFFLMVEGGRIDHAHHAGNAFRALTDTIEFANAVRVAHELTDPADTLILVTSDHGHALTFGGYPERGNPILGLIHRRSDRPTPHQYDEPDRADRRLRDQLGQPLTTLRYMDGPGYRGGVRPDYDRVDPADPDFRQEATVWTYTSTHSGEDVPVYATGPGAEVLHGVLEQNVIFHALLQAHPVLRRLADELKNEQGFPAWDKARKHSPTPRCEPGRLGTPGDC